MKTLSSGIEQLAWRTKGAREVNGPHLDAAGHAHTEHSSVSCAGVAAHGKQLFEQQINAATFLRVILSALDDEDITRDFPWVTVFAADSSADVFYRE